MRQFCLPYLMDYKELSVTLRYFKVICALQDFYFVERVLNFRELHPYLVRQRTTQKFVNEIKLCVGVLNYAERHWYFRTAVKFIIEEL